jgi:hypothetical protein
MLDLHDAACWFRRALGRMAEMRAWTCRDIQNYGGRRHGWCPKTFWLAHGNGMKARPVRSSPIRRGVDRGVPYPLGERGPIHHALRRFQLLPQ